MQEIKGKKNQIAVRGTVAIIVGTIGLIIFSFLGCAFLFRKIPPMELVEHDSKQLVFFTISFICFSTSAFFFGVVVSGFIQLVNQWFGNTGKWGRRGKRGRG